MARALRFVDDDGQAIELDANDTAALLTLVGDLDAATVSACPDCGSRVLAAVAFVDLLDASAPHPRTGDLRDFADDAPTLHIYVVDDASQCAHASWRDPLADEWFDVVDVSGPEARR